MSFAPYQEIIFFAKGYHLVQDGRRKDLVLGNFVVTQGKQQRPEVLSVMLYLRRFHLVHPRHPERRPVLHAAKLGCAFKRTQEFLHRVFVVAILPVRIAAAARADGIEDLFSFQCVPAFAMRKNCVRIG